MQDEEDSTSQNKVQFLIHPQCLKKFLMRCENRDKYAEYYLLLEKCVKYYNEYQLLKIQDKINEINKIKLLQLDKS